MSKKTPVNSELLRILPVHDAEFVSIGIISFLDGAVQLSLVFTLHADESRFLDESSGIGWMK